MHKDNPHYISLDDSIEKVLSPSEQRELALMVEIDVLKAALEKYADDGNWKMMNDTDYYSFILETFGYEIAQQALEKIK